MYINPSCRSQKGFTFMEMMVGFAVSGVILTALISFIIYAAKGFAALENYTDLEQKSQIALDTMTREIRETQSLTSFQNNRTINGQRVTNVVTFLDYDGNPLTYNFTNNILLRQKGGSDTMLLTNVDFLTFLIYQRIPLPGTFDEYPTTNAPNCKLISVSWICSRSILGSRLNTESVQTAKIVIRKQ